MAFSIFLVLLSEYIVDWVKHCFITKFNHLTPDIYPQFHRMLTEDVVDKKVSAGVCVSVCVSAGLYP